MCFLSNFVLYKSDDRWPKQMSPKITEGEK